MNSKKKIRINILSPGRFHVCDLARELDKNGFDVKFYSFVPTKRAISFGLPKRCSVSLVVLLSPFLFLSKVILKGRRWPQILLKIIQDVLTELLMRRCDVCIAMSGSFLYAPRHAKKQGALIIFERGSKHILEQRRVLESIPALKGTKPIPDINVMRELACYSFADYIAISTQHVRDSFLLHDYPAEKLFINPYGVDLSMFKPMPEVKKEYDVLMVGGWSYRKGCDLIIEAIRKTELRFLHVGGIVDLPFPSDDPLFTHVNPVEQRQLIWYYNKSRVFVIPSREEGLAMVQMQAIACNLPLVGSRDSGAVDLKAMVEKPEYVTIINDYTGEAVAAALRSALRSYATLTTPYAGKAIENLTWEAYGRRYASFLHKVCGSNS